MNRRLIRPQAALTPGLDVGALAPMVDMMTLLMVFLLRTWSTEVAPAPPEGRFELASTTAEGSRRPAVELMIASDAIYVEGRRVVSTAAVHQDGLIREVYDPLMMMRSRGRVEVHAHAEVPYAVLRRVLHTARSAGYTELSLVAVNSGGL